MKDENKTQTQLIDELDELRRRVDELEEEKVLGGEGEAEQEKNLRLSEGETAIRTRLVEMDKTQDLGATVRGISRVLKEVGVDHDSCTIQVVNETGTAFFSIGVQAKPAELVECLSNFPDISLPKAAINAQWYPWVIDVWKTGEPRYDPCATEASHMEPGLSVLDVPFSHGTLAINSSRSNAFGEGDIAILQRFSAVLSDGFQHFLDIIARQQAEEKLKEKDRLLAAFHKIGQTTLSSLNVGQILARLARQILEAGIFRSLMVARVDERTRTVEVVENPFRGNPIIDEQKSPIGVRYDLDDDNITAEVARTGEMQVIEEWDERFDAKIDSPELRRGNVSYFIPVKRGDRVLAVLATGSPIEEKPEVLHRIEVMQPLLGQVVVALEHARLYENVQREIAERKQAEETLRKSRHDLARAQHIGRLGNWDWDVQGNSLTWSDEMYHIWGVETDFELSYEIIENMLHPDDREMNREKVEQLASGVDFVEWEFRIIRPNGEVRSIHQATQASYDETGSVRRIFGIMQDITERKQAEETIRWEYAVREAENSIRARIAAIDQPTDLWDVVEEIRQQLIKLGVEHDSCSVQIVNAEGTDFFSIGEGKPENWQTWTDDLLTTEGIDITPELSWPKVTPYSEIHPWVIEVWKTGNPRYDPCISEGPDLLSGMSLIDVPFSHGTLAINNLKNRTFCEKDILLLQQFAAVLSAGFQRFIDVVERIQAEEKLQKSQARYRALVEAAFAGIGITDPEENLTFANTALTEMLGYAPEELIGMNLSQLADPEEIVKYREGTERRREGVQDHYESLLYRKDGKPLNVLVSAAPLMASDGTFEGSMGIIIDVTRSKLMEQELSSLERLRALGELSAGFCHNFNNILTHIMGPVQLLKRHTDNPRATREAEEILAGANRARDLVQQLNRAVQEEQDGTLHPVSVNEGVKQTLEVTRPRWKDQSEAHGIAIEVVTELEEVPAICGTASDLDTILQNLLFNALDAMLEGGTITLRTQAVEEHVQLTVTDTGKGMDEETRKRVFEPFFTTKMDIGRGLGLTTVRGTVTRWGGSIDVDSTPGRGTTFTLRFPRRD